MNLATGILLGVGAAAAGFVAVEFAVRAWLRARGRAYVWAPFTHLRMVLDRETLPDLDPVAEHRINEEGERGDPLPRDRSSLYRVLVVGGSAAECWFLDQASSWPHVVQETLARPENLRALQVEHVHVGNIARSLVTARHVDAILERVLPRYDHLDAIVFMVGASDIITWLESGTPPRVDEKPITSSMLFAQHPDAPFGWTPKTLAMRRIASYWRHRVARPVEVREQAGKRLGEARRMRQRAQEIVREMPDPKPMIAGFETWFARLLARAKAKAPLVMVVRQPWLEKDLTADEQKRMWSFATGRPYAGEVKRYYAHEVGWKLHRLVDARVEQMAREAGVEQVDLMKVVPGDMVHYYDDHHHTPTGNRLIGRVVAQALIDSVVRSRGTRASTGDATSNDDASHPNVESPTAARR